MEAAKNIDPTYGDEVAAVEVGMAMLVRLAEKVPRASEGRRTLAEACIPLRAYLERADARV